MQFSILNLSHSLEKDSILTPAIFYTHHLSPHQVWFAGEVGMSTVPGVCSSHWQSPPQRHIPRTHQDPPPRLSTEGTVSLLLQDHHRHWERTYPFHVTLSHWKVYTSSERVTVRILEDCCGVSNLCLIWLSLTVCVCPVVVLGAREERNSPTCPTWPGQLQRSASLPYYLYLSPVFFLKRNFVTLIFLFFFPVAHFTLGKNLTIVTGTYNVHFNVNIQLFVCVLYCT